MASLNDAEGITNTWLRSRLASIPMIPRPVHGNQEISDWIERVVIPTNEVWVAEVHGQVVAVLVLDDGWLHQLYIDPDWTRRGLGTSLVERAKLRRPRGLDLWTFATNDDARRFYEGHGFTAGETSDQNEESAIAIHYRWEGEPVHLEAGPAPSPDFRRFEDGDRTEVHRLHVEALESTNALIHLDNYYADLDDVEGYYIARGGEFIVGELEGAIVAMGGLEVHPGGVAELRRMRVSPEAQGRGIGRHLLRLLEQAAVDLGCDRIELDTTVNQKAAQALFTSAGYVETRRGSKGGPLETIFYVKAV